MSHRHQICLCVLKHSLLLLLLLLLDLSGSGETRETVDMMAGLAVLVEQYLGKQSRAAVRQGRYCRVYVSRCLRWTHTSDVCRI
jgi:hypothetical protein